MPSISCKIAEKMATIHSLDIPISKEPDWLWNTMERWLKNVDSILKQFEYVKIKYIVLYATNSKLIIFQVKNN